MAISRNANKDGLLIESVTVTDIVDYADRENDRFAYKHAGMNVNLSEAENELGKEIKSGDKVKLTFTGDNQEMLKEMSIIMSDVCVTKYLK